MKTIIPTICSAKWQAATDELTKTKSTILTYAVLGAKPSGNEFS